MSNDDEVKREGREVKALQANADPESALSPIDDRFRYRAITEDQRLVFRWRPDGTLTFVSDAYCRYFGLSADRWLGRSLLSVVADADRERVSRHMASLSVTNPVEAIECRVIIPSGEARWQIWVDTVVLDGAEAISEVESVARDITDQQRMKAELEERIALAQAFFESTAQGIIGVNRDGIIVLCNPKAEDLFGYGPGELLKKPVDMLVPDRIKEVHRRHIAAYFEMPRARPMGLGMNLAGLRKDGREIPIEVSLTFVPYAQGGLAIAFHSDISERVLQERQARHLEKLTALGSLAAGVAHEINNPLGIILSRIELMLMDTAEQHAPAETVEDLHTLQRQAQRLRRITETLLKYSRRRPPDHQPVDLATVVNDTLLLARYELGRDGIQVSTSFAPDVPRVLGDPTALQQVFMNLLLNARDAMAGGGSLRIDVTWAPNQPGSVRLEVADTGCGMTADVLAKIAQPFFTTKSHGTGLGLSVSYTIIREHGGTVDVSSEPGRGTTFGITLPGIPASSPA
jgi:PAS domain S-box-containing protein